VTDSVWKPHVTVAAIIQDAGRFLLVEEHTDEGIRINQPAGHLEPDESLEAAAVREALEETAYLFRPEWLVGIYRWRQPAADRVYLRFAFAGPVLGHEPHRSLDTGILRPLWLSLDEIRAQRARHRSPLVERCIEDYLAGHRHPLGLLAHYP
jgi:8-oxo-dGTP pyrophosphatase MutT (NUDIX family)